MILNLSFATFVRMLHEIIQTEERYRSNQQILLLICTHIGYITTYLEDSLVCINLASRIFQYLIISIDKLFH